MKTEIVKISEVKINPNNPRLIKDDKFKKLVKSIQDFPEMLNIRPIVVNSDMIILGGNMRLKACKEAGLKEVPIIKADELTEEKQREFLIKDNISGGEWDWDVLANEWDVEELNAWGLDILDVESKDDNEYSAKIESPIYEPKGEKYSISEIYNVEKYTELVNKINSSNIDSDIKEFLKLSATRFIEYDYRKIAEYYSSSDQEVQSLFQDVALVIIDFEKAIDKGFIELTKSLSEQYNLEYE
jgi:hypothetical protein